MGEKSKMQSNDKTQTLNSTESIFPFDPMAFSVSTEEKQGVVASVPPPGRPFTKGRSGNPKGRPKGSRNRLTDSVLRKIVQDFAEHGEEVLERVRTDEPATYLKLILSLLPRELVMQFEQHRPGEAATLSDEEVVELSSHQQRQQLVECVYTNKPPQIMSRR